MKRNDAEQIGEMIRKFFRQNALEAPLNEYRLIQAWKDVVGSAITNIRVIFILRIKFFMYISLHPCFVKS